MSEPDFRTFIKSFQNKIGKIRGANLNEQISFLRNRYIKVSLDSRRESESGLDDSRYRLCYASVHEKIAEKLSQENFSNVENILKYCYEQGELCFKSRTFSQGYIDAYGYIIAELEAIAGD